MLLVKRFILITQIWIFYGLKILDVFQTLTNTLSLFITFVLKDFLDKSCLEILNF